MRKNKGSDLVDYAIPTLLVGVVLGLGLFSFVSNGSILGFLSASGNMSSNNGTMDIAAPGSNPICNAPGCFGGTTSNPVKRCSGKLCITDYGDHITNQNI